MTVAETSVQAYYGAERLSRQRCIQVREFIEANPDVCNEDISRGLRMPIQTVTPRVKELKENGVVWVTGRKKTSTGAGAKTYRVACCPRCLSARLEATRIDSQRFRYYCWICGHTFIARLGERSEDIVEVLA